MHAMLLPIEKNSEKFIPFCFLQRMPKEVIGVPSFLITVISILICMVFNETLKLKDPKCAAVKDNKHASG